MAINPYKPQLTPAQRRAVNAGREQLLLTFNRAPYNAGQRRGEFAVEHCGEWVDRIGSLDEFFISHAEAPLDDAWRDFERAGPVGTMLTPQGRDSYRLLVPHALYMDFARAHRYGLPCALDAPCVCTLALQLLAAGACAYAALLWAPTAEGD